jgi:RNA polymerase sigma-70 factor (ECF subfamily)
MNVTERKLRRSESDEQYFGRLYEQNFGRVAAYLLARADRDSATEAVARTFEIAWRRLRDVPSEPLPWLLGVARRVLSDQRRAQGRRNALIERIAETATETSDDHAEAVAAGGLVLAAIKDLTPFQQEALLLIAWDGLSEREAAAVLGCSRGAVALRLHRARKQLRSALDRAAPESSFVGDASSDAAPLPPVHLSTKETT